MIKTKIFISLLLISQIGFSQIETLVQGQVLCDNIPVMGVEVINLITERTTVTDNLGRFSIFAEPDDLLVFISKKYEYKKILLKQEDINRNDLIISLLKKPEELKEIVITKPFVPVAFDFDSKKIVDQKYFHEEPFSLKNKFVYDGTIENGMDFVQIGRRLLNLIRKNKTHTPKPEFKQLVTTLYDQSFFIKTLKLKPEQINLFIDFCNSDPKSKMIFDGDNVLEVTEFLISKNDAFKKLPTTEK